MNVLLVEDDNAHAELIQRMLCRSLADEPSVNVLRAPTGHRALLLLEQRPVELILLDYSLPDRDGLEVLDAIRTRNVDVPVIFLTAADSAEVCARAFKGGAVDYVVKKLNYLELLPSVISTARGAVSARPAGTVDTSTGMVGEGPAALRLREVVTRAAQSTSTVLIEGETGTGKELVAREIHMRGFRARKPFVTLNCAAIPDALFESELFGCARGAYTGATSDRTGHLESADGGTLVLDEIEALPLPLQAKLLRVIQQREFKPLGSTRTVAVDFRLIATTNESLERLIDQGRFRRDLFYRLDVLRLRVPPLRERREDLPRLVRHFVARYNQRNGTRFGSLSDDALAALARRSWPGNIRQLENVIERTLVNSTGPAIDEREIVEPTDAAPEPDEREHIRDALTRNRWNREQTAKELGLSRVTLWRKMTRLGLAD
ncbi:MAG: sigma-54-dependent transcriptional regulator [Candidatus Binatia bacterium]